MRPEVVVSFHEGAVELLLVATTSSSSSEPSSAAARERFFFMEPAREPAAEERLGRSAAFFTVLLAFVAVEDSEEAAFPLFRLKSWLRRVRRLEGHGTSRL